MAANEPAFQQRGSYMLQTIIQREYYLPWAPERFEKWYGSDTPKGPRT